MKKYGSNAGNEAKEGAVVLNDFELEKLIGRGPSTEVWSAKRADSRGRFAVKVATELAMAKISTAKRMRLNADMRAVARVDHPNLVELVATGSIDRLAAIALDFVDGRDLEALIRTGRAMPSESLNILCSQIPAAIHALNKSGIIHGGVTTWNIVARSPRDFILTDPLGPRIAMFHGTEDAAAEKRSPFIAPEAAEGHAKVASDMYGFGAVIWTILAGSPPDRPRGAAGPNIRAVKGSVAVEVNDLIKLLLDPDPEKRPNPVAFMDEWKRLSAGNAAPASIKSKPKVRRPKSMPSQRGAAGHSATPAKPVRSVGTPAKPVRAVKAGASADDAATGGTTKFNPMRGQKKTPARRPDVQPVAPEPLPDPGPATRPRPPQNSIPTLGAIVERYMMLMPTWLDELGQSIEANKPTEAARNVGSLLAGAELLGMQSFARMLEMVSTLVTNGHFEQAYAMVDQLNEDLAGSIDDILPLLD